MSVLAVVPCPDLVSVLLTVLCPDSSCVVCPLPWPLLAVLSSIVCQSVLTNHSICSGLCAQTLPAEVRLERRLRCAPAPERPLLTLVRGLGQQLESVSQRLARQQALSQQVARHGAATHRWLVLTLFIVAVLALCNAYLLYKSSGVCDLTQASRHRQAPRLAHGSVRP